MAEFGSQASQLVSTIYDQWMYGQVTAPSGTHQADLLPVRAGRAIPPPLPLEPDTKDAWRIDGPPPVCLAGPHTAEISPAPHDQTPGAALPSFESTVAPRHSAFRRRTWRECWQGGLRYWVTSLVAHLAILLLLALVVTAVVLPVRQQLTLSLAPTAALPEPVSSFELQDAPLDLPPAEKPTIEPPLPEPPMPEPVEQPVAYQAESAPLIDIAALPPGPLLGPGRGEEEGEDEGEGFGPGGAGEGEGGGGGGGGGGGTRRGNPSFMGIAGDFDSVIFLLDGSGSMHVAKYEALTRELIRSLQELGNEGSFSIAIFHDRTHYYSQRLLPCTPGNIARARSWLNDTPLGGDNLPNEAMAWAISCQPDAIFLLSDNDVFSPAFTPGLIAMLAQSRPAPVVHTVNFDLNATTAMASATFMTMFAETTGASMSHPLTLLPEDFRRIGLVAATPAFNRMQSMSPPQMALSLPTLEPTEQWLTLLLLEKRSLLMSSEEKDLMAEPLEWLIENEPQLAEYAECVLRRFEDPQSPDLADPPAAFVVLPQLVENAAVPAPQEEPQEELSKPVNLRPLVEPPAARLSLQEHLQVHEEKSGEAVGQEYFETLLWLMEEEPDPQLLAQAHERIEQLYPHLCDDLKTCHFAIDWQNAQFWLQLQQMPAAELADAIDTFHPALQKLGLLTATRRAHALRPYDAITLGQGALPALESSDPQNRQLAHELLVELAAAQTISFTPSPTDAAATRTQAWCEYWRYLQAVRQCHEDQPAALLSKLQENKPAIAAAAATMLAARLPSLEPAQYHDCGAALAHWVERTSLPYAQQAHRQALAKLAPGYAEYESWQAYWEEEGRDIAYHAIERRAQALLNRANSFERANKSQRARECYESIVSQYPETAAAAAATQRLEGAGAL